MHCRLFEGVRATHKIVLALVKNPGGATAIEYGPIAALRGRALGGRKVIFAHDCIGPEAQAVAAALKAARREEHR
jgi:hypothetical protein